MDRDAPLTVTWFSRRLAPAIAILALAVAAGFVAWRLRPAEPRALRLALERESSRGLVLPGGERGADHEMPVPRGQATTPDAALDTAVSRASRRYEAGDCSASATYEVAAGLLVTGNIEAARDYINEGLRAHPRDRRLGILAAAVHYRNSDLERAEDVLRGVLQRSPDDALVALDLAIVVAERGAQDQARALLEAVMQDDPWSPLGRRAGQVRGRLMRAR